MTRILPKFSLLVLSCVIVCRFSNLVSAEYTIERHDDGIQVLDDGALVADYLTMSKSKPIVWPLIGPGGERMTRDYPMVPDSKNEKHDHPHHRSFWFTHGDVNGTDFWLEGNEGGITEHQEFTQVSGGKNAVVAARNIWKTPDGKVVLGEHRRYTFSKDRTVRILDCDFVLTAVNGEVNFGDTKEGTFGIRIASSMKVDAKLGGKITNSNGDNDTDAWGVKADWVDYVGPIGDKTLGIAILCHPSTFNYPNRWHVRTYGLFAANPFGVHHFLRQDEPTKGVSLPAGESLTFRYRVLLHEGNTEQAKLDQRQAEFAKQEYEPLKK